MGCKKLSYHHSEAGELIFPKYHLQVVSNNIPAPKKHDNANTFGFNGKLRDNKLGTITNYDYGFRIYNPGIARFLSVDPLKKSYPYYTPYQFAGNTPIAAIDLDGLEERLSYMAKHKYKPVFTKNAGNIGERTASAVNNINHLLYNTGANMVNFFSGTSNTVLDIADGHYNNVTGPVILAKFGQTAVAGIEAANDYRINTPINEIAADIGNSFIDGMTKMENYEAALEMLLFHKASRGPRTSTADLSKSASGPTMANNTVGWKVGNPINNLTTAGNVPKWSTVRQRYWKNRAHNATANEFSPTVMKRMGKGLAPQRFNPKTGKMESMELHHTPPQREGGLFDVKEVWPEEHAAQDEFRKLSKTGTDG